ncbi:MAG TPA: ABC transporter ATP-binding protein [Candidatus Alectryocaccomicrobium excrementavium]|uniref:ABC transporter ATP-binding protein n=1 Tax=Candidatus Alectryocaccomicrobium excrementavium TaxID=2840668 RepID=A0A9D1FYE9_9FIRM|nr:ABC transporter ATP-binding protein [Candidatus Alectryocaccomicrobium excrementavium]
MNDITLTNIEKKFGDKILFHDFSLAIERGEFLAIMGESGAGKTTLLNIMGLLEKPDSGAVTICGQKNPAFSSRAAVELRRHRISYLFQNYGLVDTETVENNMRTATHFKRIGKKEERRLIAEALEQAGLKGYEKRKVYTLSGGEQQRVALAKVIAKSPQIIFADEPTGSLDEHNRNDVLAILKEFHRRGKTIVVVTHDPYVNACAARHIMLKSAI